MNYYRDPATSEVYAYDDQQVEEGYVKEGLVVMIPAEVEAHVNKPIPVDPPTSEQLASLERRWRDSELTIADIEVNKSMDTSSPNEVLWRQYREALRQWPQTVGFPDPSFRPIPPEV